ncbi:hypothetical protein [Sinirhodobacter huangdaonensis]|uniref:Uncharacterized protein n=1 Tax=Paenirhodobacter huangdaonensis TaxID=2501515 RepID=A0A443M026_9RHOB|nr:hypothetical protein [Sinirhodobacter huangdaonensis]RWR54884.1 hypothetical protein EOW66_02120 [Sinirhodobacter huangdaonensis]
MADLLDAWLKLGLDIDDFLSATPRLYMLVTRAAVAARHRADDGMIHGAWLGAILGRAKKIPALDSLLSRPADADDDPEMRAAEQRAEMAALREVMAAQGRTRSWSEWRES